MRRLLFCSIAPLLSVVALVAAPRARDAQTAGTVQRIDLAAQLAAGKLRAVNREVTPLSGTAGAVQMSKKANPGLVWIQGTDFAEGTIDIDVRGKDIPQQSFLGIAFHGKDDATYESVYLRPFNFRTPDPASHQHAVQYMMLPDFDWPRLRQQFPEEFENPVDASIVPTAWVPLRVVVKGQAIQIYVGQAKTPALDVRKLGSLTRGLVGLWTGNNSDGDFANLRITPAK